MENIQKRRHRAGVFSLVLILMTLFSGLSAMAAEEAPRRVIHVVYDDSGSMIGTGGQEVDTWCQAKYAMEVFAALLGERDSLNIYAMSDYEGAAQPDPRLMLNGTDGQTANVAKVHNMLTKAGNTPFAAVRKAYADLAAAAADEKWLVVLTDGEFQGVEDIDGFFRQKDPSVRVMFLGMGPAAQGITPDEASGIYFEQAQTSKQILDKITGICTRIFNSDRLEVNVSAKTLSFDVPMAELVVFAQGANAEIQNITGEDGTVYAASSAPVTVQYSEKAAENRDDGIVDRDLKGSLLTFKDDFAQGSYKLNVSGADTIEVYYKPNVEVAAYLTSADGEEVTDLQNLKAGSYTLTFGLVKAGTSEKVNQSALLGDVSYSAQVTNNGETQDKTYASGDSIELEEGSLVIDVVAHYLEYNTVSTHLDYSIYQDKELALSVQDNPVYQLTKDGFQTGDPITVKTTVDGREPSAEEWKNMTLPQVQFADTKLFGEPEVKKGSTPGLYEIYPALPDGKADSSLYGDCPFTVTYEGKNGEATWAGSTEGVLKTQDQRSWLQRYADKIRKIALWTAGIILVLGYFPWFKPRFPKTLKSRPYIKCRAMDPRLRSADEKGTFKKQRLYSLLPYVAERGSLKFVPKGTMGVPTATIQAMRDGGIWLTNAKAYAGRKEIAFNSLPVPENTKKRMRISAGVTITYKTPVMTYTCIPTQTK